VVRKQRIVRIQRIRVLWNMSTMKKADQLRVNFATLKISLLLPMANMFLFPSYIVMLYNHKKLH
jgi:hypothetical protein